jgi:hypothetical protein
MPSSEMLGRLALEGTDVAEEHIAYIIRFQRVSELGTTLAVTSNRRTQRNIPGYSILHIHRPENLRSYVHIRNLLTDDIK